MAEGPGLAGDLLGVAVLAHRVDLVVARAGDAEGARERPLPEPLADAVGLAGEHRLVEGEAAALGHLAVGDQLVAGLDPDPVARDDLLGAQLDQLAVADDLRLRRDQQREALERLLRLQLLPDPDVAVDHRDEAEERVGEQPQREHDDEEDADDQVEEGEDVAGDDARDRAARPVLDRPELAQPLGGLLARQTARDDAGRSLPHC